MAGLETLTRGDPYFVDGNVILRSSSNILYRVHIGVLARQSDVFDVFRLPQPNEPSSEHVLDGCPVIPMSDHPIELEHLLHALYDGVTFHNNSVKDFYHLSAILRLSTKYCMNALRLKAIRYLAATWGTTLEGHDDIIHQAMTRPFNPENGSYPHVHPLHVLNLARETNVEVVIPSALYFLSLYPLPLLLEGSHPKLSVDVTHPSRPSSQIGAQDIAHYGLIYQYRLEKMLYFIRTLCLDRPLATNCSKAGTTSILAGRRVTFRNCSHVINKMGAMLSRSWELRTGPLHFMQQAVGELPKIGLCDPCREAFEEDVRALREEVWNRIPALVGLPSWDVLKRQLEE